MPRQAELSPQRLATLAPRALATPRLRLAVPAAADGAAFADSINASRTALDFVGWARAHRDAAWGARFCSDDAACVDRGEALIFHATELASGAYVGRIDLHSFDFDAPRCEIGYVGDVRVAGRGLMREATLAVVALAFELGFVRVHALSDIHNERALRFAESLGFEREGVLRNWERHPDGRLTRQVMYAAYAPDAT